MLDTLQKLLSDPHFHMMLNHSILWDSLIINRRKPYTYRVFTQYKDLRICLHEFEDCTNTESFVHPHAWPAAFTVLEGGYNLKIGQSKNTLDTPENWHTLNIMAGSSYEMIDPLEWHAITPFEKTTTIMINGPKYTTPHSAVRTTKGKDLEKIKEKDKEKFLKRIKNLLGI